MFITRLDTSGLVYFNQTYNDNPWTFGNWIEETPQGNYLASGTSGSSIWAIEVDSNGGEIRRQRFYTTPTQAVFGDGACIRQAPGGRYVVTGSPLSFSPSFFYFGNYSAFSSTSELWGGEQNGSCLPPHVQDDGSIVLYANRGGFEYLTKYSSDGTGVWDWPVQSPTFSSVPVMRVFSYLSDSSVIAIGDIFFPSPAYNDFYLCRIRGVGVPYDPTQPVAAKPRYKGLPPLIAYPNPYSGPLTVHTRARQPLAVYSLSGQKRLEHAADPSGTTVLDLSGLPIGMYVLRQGEVATKILKD